jgi:hypothetical protein
MLALLDYPGFTVQLKVNFESGTPAESAGMKFVGSEGTITTSTTRLTLARRPREKEPGYTIDTFPEAVQKDFLERYRKEYPPARASADGLRPDRDDTYSPPQGFNPQREHHRAFYESIRQGKPSVEDAVFGYRAAGPALLTNVSYFEKRVCTWDPETLS